MEQVTRIDADVSALSLTVAPGLALEVVYDDEGTLTASWQGSGWWRVAEA
jgi:hypothetical protein